MLKHSLLILVLSIILGISAQSQAQEACAELCTEYYGSITITKAGDNAGRISIWNGSDTTYIQWNSDYIRLSVESIEQEANGGIWFFWGAQAQTETPCFVRWGGNNQTGYNHTTGCNPVEEAFDYMNVQLNQE